LQFFTIPPKSYFAVGKIKQKKMGSFAFFKKKATITEMQNFKVQIQDDFKFNRNTLKILGRNVTDSMW